MCRQQPRLWMSRCRAADWRQRFQWASFSHPWTRFQAKMINCLARLIITRACGFKVFNCERADQATSGCKCRCQLNRQHWSPCWCANAVQLHSQAWSCYEPEQKSESHARQIYKCGFRRRNQSSCFSIVPPFQTAVEVPFALPSLWTSSFAQQAIRFPWTFLNPKSAVKMISCSKQQKLTAGFLLPKPSKWKSTY